MDAVQDRDFLLSSAMGWFEIHAAEGLGIPGHGVLLADNFDDDGHYMMPSGRSRPQGPPPLVVRPLKEKGRKDLRGMALVSAFFATPGVSMAVISGARGQFDAAFIGGLSFLALPLALAAAWIHQHWRRIVLTTEEIAILGPLVHRRRSCANAAHVVRADVIIPRRVVYTLFVLDFHGRVLIRVNGFNFARHDLDQVVARLRLPVSGPDRPLDPGRLAKMYPGIVPFYEAQPLAFGCVMGVAGSALVIFFAVIMTFML